MSTSAVNTTPEKRCLWPNCQYKTETNCSLKKHQFIHLKQQTIDCTVNECHKKFTSEALMMSHKKTHRRYDCDYANCGHTFNFPFKLKDHINRCHIKEVKRFECLVNACDKRFFTTRELNRHQNNIHWKPFKCHYFGCDASYGTKSAYTKHIARKHFQMKK